ncbi:hypothetical protein LEP1GSC038_2439 [Leptospira weilii str. 2006001855]|uniref:Uncharacterized protein n=1 Tax=Leptospira weilii str. 2006001855 TaxID=996804 RepID=M6FWE1_9LEPT|nr:hypothetical protein LEP1GSC038_2439 [Leptospira weilii str. 2006001855]
MGRVNSTERFLWGAFWVRHDLETFQKRMKALEAFMAQGDSPVLTESQVQALEKRKLEKQVEGEIETEHPGYLGCQDTYYVGTIKGVGGFTSKPLSTPILK